MLTLLAFAFANPGDLDGDGVPDCDELDEDTDGDGLFNVEDPDDDGDGVLTADEDGQSPGDPTQTNSDLPSPGDPLDWFVNGDLVPDYLDADDDGDGRPTLAELGNGNTDDAAGLPACAPAQTLGCSDALPDYLDADDDGDGVPSFAELLHGDPVNGDTDGDGFGDAEEWFNWLDPTVVSAVDYIDFCDVPLPTDAAGYYLPDSATDPDGDGRPGVRDWSSPWDRDCDGSPNVDDIDDDGDGMNTGLYLSVGWEGGADQDCLPGTLIQQGDGVPNYLDVDSDNQAMLVAPGTHPNCPIGAPGPCELRTDGAEGLSDANANFIPDGYECDVPSVGIDDLDQDGLADSLESGFCPVDFITTPICGAFTPFFGLGCDLNPDADCDGRLDCLEAGVPCPTVPPSMVPTTVLPGPLPDTDGDLIPDVFDGDDDGDGVLTIDESDGDDDGDGVENALDADDEDGPLGDLDGDGLGNAVEEDLGLNANEADTDGDGISDDVELGSPGSPTDTDGDGTIDALDEDDDGDGILTLDEGTGDLDDDGVPDYLDDTDDRLTPTPPSNPPPTQVPEKGCNTVRSAGVSWRMWMRR